VEDERTHEKKTSLSSQLKCAYSGRDTVFTAFALALGVNLYNMLCNKHIVM